MIACPSSFLKPMAFAFLFASCCTAWAADAPVVLESGQGAAARFEHSGTGYLWTGYEDRTAGTLWAISGPRFSFETSDGKQTALGDTGAARITQEAPDGAPQVVLETDIPGSALIVRQTFTFCKDGRTLHIKTAMRSTKAPVLVERAGLLEVTVAGETLHLTGAEVASYPVFGDRIFAGVEHPSVSCQAQGDTLSLSQRPHTEIKDAWVDLPAAVFGSASNEDAASYGAEEGLRRAFLRYLDTVRIKPADLHVHYNDWWTAPIPSSEKFVLENFAALKRDLFDTTGFFFDAYAMDMGWSDPNTVWEIDTKNFPEGFGRVRDALATVGCRPGLWVSPSSLYPPALDNKWLASAGYEVIPAIKDKWPNMDAACLALGGKYQKAFKEALLKHAQAANLAHVKFDGLLIQCEAENHGHKPGVESQLSIAEGLMDVFDALREINPEIALEPTCFWYPSPWWLMHVPFCIGSFGADSPRGRCPCPDWVESMTTARDIENLKGRGILMPSSALQCFDIVVQWPGAFQNHASMAIGRGRWFISSYINPEYMNHEEWRFFADLIAWARHNREFLQEPFPIGGDPAQRQSYGYAFLGETRRLYCLRNPWITEASFAFPENSTTAPFGPYTEVRTLYPRRELLARVAKGEALPPVPLGPYDTVFVEMVPSEQEPDTIKEKASKPRVAWRPKGEPVMKRIAFEEEPAALAPSWTCPDGEATEMLEFQTAAKLTVRGALSSELCILCEGDEEISASSCVVTIDGKLAPIEDSSSFKSFAVGPVTNENWMWFLAPVPSGRHNIAIRVRMKNVDENSVAVYLRGTVKANPSEPPFTEGPSYPLYREGQRGWSQLLVPTVQGSSAPAAMERCPREVIRIDGVYLDSLQRTEASTGIVQQNRPLSGEYLSMGPRSLFRRGLGTCAPGRIVYDIPTGYTAFAATIGCQREAATYGSVVFLVEADGKELFRSPVMHHGSTPIDVRVPIGGASQLALIVDNAGDNSSYDHANWADARFLK